MSRYYKAEDVIRKRAEDLADTSYWEWGNPKNVDEWVEVAEMEFKDLPTIEVSDKADRPFEYFEGYEDGKKSVEVSEDCISREWLIKALDNLDWYDFDMFYKVVENAPSVTTEQSSMVGEWIDPYKAGYEKAMLEVMEAHPNINKVGKWLRKDGRVWSRCSVCGSGSSFETNYCGNCGTAMEGNDVDVSE